MLTPKDVRLAIGTLCCTAGSISFAATPLENDVPVTGLAAATGETSNYTIEVANTEGPLNFTISGGSGDADLYVRFNQEPDLRNYDCRPFLDGNNENCTYNNPPAGTYHVMLRAYRSFSNLSLVASYPQDTVNPAPDNAVISLQKGQTLSGQAGASGQETYYVFAVPEDAINVEFKTNGGTGDADLYVRFGATPTVNGWDCRPYSPGNTETCTVPQGQQGNYYVMLRGYNAYSGVNISADYSTTGGGGGSGECQLSPIEQEFLDAHNAARSQGRTCGGQFYPAAPALTWSCQLAEAAERHSNDMAFTIRGLNHRGSDGSRAGDRISDTGYDWRAWAENIAAGQTSVEQVMASWINSPGHCGNIMSTSVTQLGGSMIQNNNTNYRYWWTAVFARPQ